ncbi:chorismate mutase [Antrihabitans cavernicola]|uniref:Chorismate mutase n=1 Tax=Antrihabitans cavernicola TaxID=2495913 RepID=A0A5A7SAQ1_9NOCA|nr:chorismate mutase [Spelaeibacter cavernicola]KAA0021927.1 chorismate mutase [Spelaeibacter cavernicola]
MNIFIDYPESEERLITSEAEIGELCRGVDGIDDQILAAVVSRIELSRRIATVERAAGRCHQHSRDNAVISRYGQLGRDGRALGRLMVRLAHPHRATG